MCKVESCGFPHRTNHSHKCWLCILQLPAEKKHQTVAWTNTPIQNSCRQTNRDKPLLQLRSEFLYKTDVGKYYLFRKPVIITKVHLYIQSEAETIEQIQFQQTECDMSLLLLLPLSTLGRWCSGVHSQSECWWGCCAPGGARSAALGPSARSRPLYRPTPG